MKTASITMIIGSALLFGLFFYPLWSITLEAPQYPSGIGMYIHLDGLKGHEKHDIQNIDGLNHYIGMRKLPEKVDMWEFTAFPKVVGVMAILGITIGVLGFFKKVSYKWFLGWLILMIVIGVLGIIDFNAWMTEYGTTLDPKAIMKMTDADGNPLSYKPPLFGSKNILNFTAHSYPALGAVLMGIGMFLTLVAYFIGLKKSKVV